MSSWVLWRVGGQHEIIRRHCIVVCFLFREWEDVTRVKYLVVNNLYDKMIAWYWILLRFSISFLLCLWLLNEYILVMWQMLKCGVKKIRNEIDIGIPAVYTFFCVCGEILIWSYIESCAVSDCFSVNELWFNIIFDEIACYIKIMYFQSIWNCWCHLFPPGIFMLYKNNMHPTMVCISNFL